jgi:hypothetical protein
MKWAKIKQEISNALELIKQGDRTLDNYSGMFRFILEKRIRGK